MITASRLFLPIRYLNVYHLSCQSPTIALAGCEAAYDRSAVMGLCFAAENRLRHQVKLGLHKRMKGGVQ
jgi:hypothetical protein